MLRSSNYMPARVSEIFVSLAAFGLPNVMIRIVSCSILSQIHKNLTTIEVI